MRRAKRKNKEKNKKKQVLIVVLSVVLIIVLVLSAFIVVKHIKNKNKDEKPEQEVVNQPQEEEVITAEKSDRIKKLEELKAINPEIVGILEIDGTKINYPVVQAKDNDYYLTHNYKKEK